MQVCPGKLAGRLERIVIASAAFEVMNQRHYGSLCLSEIHWTADMDNDRLQGSEIRLYLL